MGAVDVLNPVDLVKGLRGPAGHRRLGQICAPLCRGWRGPQFTQVAAHDGQWGGSVTSRMVSASEVSDICRLNRVQMRGVR